MRSKAIGMLAMVAVSLLSGCATSPVYMTEREAAHGFVEFYVVPTYDENVVYKDAFDVSVANREDGQEQKKLGKAKGTAFDGRRLRVACAPGTHEFVLRPKCVEKDKGDQAPLSCVVDIRQDKVTPVRVAILVHETDSMGKRAVGRLLAGPALRAVMMEGAGYDMLVDVRSPQPYYDLYSTSRGGRGGVTTVEAHSETQARMIKARIEKAREGLDLRRKEGRAAFKERYEQTRSQAGTSGSLVRLAVMANDLSFTWSTMTFDE